MFRYLRNWYLGWVYPILTVIYYKKYQEHKKSGNKEQQDIYEYKLRLHIMKVAIFLHVPEQFLWDMLKEQEGFEF